MLPSPSLAHSKPHPQLFYRFRPPIPSSASTTYKPFLLDAPFQTFLIPSPVSLSSRCDTHSFHPLPNTSSKLSIPLVWFINSPKTSLMQLILHPYTPPLHLPYIQTIIKQKPLVIQTSSVVAVLEIWNLGEDSNSIEEVDNITAKIMSVRWVKLVHEQYVALPTCSKQLGTLMSHYHGRPNG